MTPLPEHARWLQVDIGEIVIEGPAMTRRECDQLRAFLERDLADRLAGPTAGDRLADPTDRDHVPGPSLSPRAAALGRGIAAGIVSSLRASLPPSPQSPPRRARGVTG